MEGRSAYAVQLKETCKLTGARWAGWLAHDGEAWSLNVQFALNKARKAVLMEFLGGGEVAAWLAGALSSNRMRSRETGASAEMLGCQRISIFPNQAARKILVVGHDRLDRESDDFWRILALAAPESLPVAPGSFVLDAPAADVELDAPYNPQGVLNGVLAHLVGRVACDAAYLTIRSGDVFRVQAIWNCPVRLQGVEITRQQDPTLAHMVETRQGLLLDRSQVDIDCSVTQILEQPVSAWMGAPIQVGQRIIGQVAFVAYHPGAFSAADLSHLTGLVSRLAYSVENSIVFAEATRYLQRLAMLNELASAAASGLSMDEVARRVIHLLRRSFGADLVGVYMISQDSQVVHVYHGDQRSEIAWEPVANTLLGRVATAGQALRSGDGQERLLESASLPLTLELTETGSRDPRGSESPSRSILAVPLKYRAKVVGVLALESIENNAFSMQDEQLLAVIASHLAGLFENIRLNDETRQRALSLQSSVRQLQAARETALDITADLDLETLFRRVIHRARELVDARGVELGLLDEKTQELQIVVAENSWREPVGPQLPAGAGLAGRVAARVAASGDPLAVADFNTWSGLASPDDQAPFRAVASVPLKFKERASGKTNVIGALTVLDDRPEKIFRPEDLQLLELLAPQVAVSIRNARLYQELGERIEAQRLAESRLLRSARLAAVGEMAAGVAHELNNPLTTVSGFVELALEDLPVESPLRIDLELVLREAQRARSVVRRMLDFSRPVDDVRGPTNLNELMRDVLALVNHQIRTRGVEICPEFCPDLPEVIVDPNQIKQVLLNLIHNAIQAMPNGGSLFLRTGSQMREGRRWVIAAVHDTGVGISPENLDRIYEPFFTTQPVGSGTGLGLSISYSIITDHGGFMEVDSIQAEGSCFTIYLPLNDEPQVIK